MPAAVNATFGQLLPSAWRDIGFPASNFVVELRHDLARHAFVDADGANIEGMGRAPLQFSATLPFYNGATPGPTETWGGHPLYPNQWRSFIAACLPHTTGYLVHPELGPVYCKVESIRSEWSADRRDGVLVHAVWLETIDDPDDLDPLLGVSPINQAVAVAQNLDDLVHTNAELAAALPQMPQYQPTLGDFLNSIQAVADGVTMAMWRAQGALNNVAYRVDSMRDALARMNSALNWPAMRDVERMSSAVNDLKKQLFESKKKIGFYTTRVNGTLAGIAGAIPASLSDVMSLNPRLLASPVVSAGATVKYYA